MKPQVYSVAQIAGYCKRVLEDDVLLNGFFLEGELSNVKAHSSGHLYFTVKDDAASMSGVMFRGFAQSLAFLPENGMRVILYARVSLYAKTGQMQLYAELMEPMGKGGLFAAFEQLKAKLAAEGLFDEARKKPLPARPACVAVVTSPTGAAVRDVITVMRKRDRGVKIVVVPCLVQGADAAADIARALREVNAWGKADVIILGRGGGAAEDLWAFNAEAVARAIAKSRIPVVSAVGHETDFTISDFAADARAATPSAAAVMVTQDAEALRTRAARAARRLENALSKRAARARAQLAPARERLARALTRGLDRKRMRLDTVMDGLHKLSPLRVLQRGYAFASDESGAVVTNASAVQPGQKLRLTFADGYVTASAETVQQTNSGENTYGEEETDI